MKLKQIESNAGNILENQSAQASEDRDRYYATAMFVRFTSYEARVARGEVTTGYMGKTFYFYGLDHLLLIMEDVMDFVGSSCAFPTFPQPTFKCRGIRGGKIGTVFQKMDDTEIITEFESLSERQQTGGYFATITVFYRQHSSMQGELRIKKQRQLFRSGLELMRMLHQALEHDTKETKIPKRSCESNE